MTAVQQEGLALAEKCKKAVDDCMLEIKISVEGPLIPTIKRITDHTMRSMELIQKLHIFSDQEIKETSDLLGPEGTGPTQPSGPGH